MSSLMGVVVTILSICVMCQCVPKPRGPPSIGFGRGEYENSVGSLCRVICSRKDMTCPPECSLTDFGMFRKRSDRVNRARAFGDLRYSCF